ncbi:hypothetical protein PVAG01_05738 [Phlyctema vagabunda]|uniref:Uncharacterized protein n=1 Tax=Phlyctema vagabunda TaxID=108571 RepID=A0ABR4PKX3_9HELO
MSGHEKKSRGVRVQGKPPIAAPRPPPKVADPKGRLNVTEEGNINASKSGIGSSPEKEELESLPATSRDKRKIAELEKELAAIHDEFERELTQLSQKLTSESETSVFWQQKHSHLNQTFLKADTDLRLLRQELGLANDSKEERDRDIKTRISSLMLDRDAFREAYNEAIAELRMKDECVKDLQGQISRLKNFISSSSKMLEQISDEGVGELMQRLGNGLQNWVITYFRRAKIDLHQSNFEVKELLARLVPTYESLASSSRLHLLQSIISHLLVENIFSSYFAGLSKPHEEQLKNAEALVREHGSAESLNHWRSTTLSILLKAAPHNLQKETEVIVNHVVGQINTILAGITDTNGGVVRDQALRALVQSAIDLSRLLRVQKAVFNVVIPQIVAHQCTLFDVEFMEDLSGEEEDALIEQEVRCITFPGIIKSGNENGEQAHLKNVIAKARVVCAMN